MAHQFTGGGGRGRARRVLGQRLGRHAQRLDGGRDAVQRAVGVNHGQHALHQVEVQRVHAVQAAELLADQGFFRRAVHLADAQARQQLAGTGLQRQGGGCRGGQRDGGAVGAAAVLGVNMLMVVVVVVVMVMVMAVVAMCVIVAMRVIMAMVMVMVMVVAGPGMWLLFDRC